MRVAARLQATIEILDALERTAEPVDRFLRSWFRARRYAGAKDRAAIAERLYFIFRHRASFAWRMRSDTPRALLIASLIAEGANQEAIAVCFSGTGYAPGPLMADERRAIGGHPEGEAPLWVRGEFPAFLEAELAHAYDENLLAELVAMQARAPVDLRVNTLKSSRAAVREALSEEGFDIHDTVLAPHGLRIPPGEGAPALGKHALHHTGAFEFQDEAAQIASHLCGAKPGERILDLAAGAGGKSLALAADMQNEGEIIACDIRERALKELGVRARRAGASIVRPVLVSREPPDGLFDAVFLDAPCSGSGTWRRQPELRWRLTSERLTSLHKQQDLLLRQGAERVRPGGRLLYATCSILRSENEDRVGEFLKRNSEFAVFPVIACWSKTLQSPPPKGLSRFFRASPYSLGTDGFFVAILVKERSAMVEGSATG